MRVEVLALAIGVALASPIERADADASSALEYQIKAAYIGKFLHYVSWPNSSAGDPVLTFALYGEDLSGPRRRRLKG